MPVPTREALPTREVTVRLRRLVAPLLVAPIVAACTGTASSSSASTSPTETTPAGTSAATSSAAASAATSAAASSATASPTPTRILISLANGKIQGPATVKMKVGDTIELRIATDRAATIHAHGFEVEKDLAAGETGSLILTAPASLAGGQYAVEDHVSDKTITQIQITN
jgi:plastocyanin